MCFHNFFNTNVKILNDSYFSNEVVFCGKKGKSMGKFT